MNAPASQIYVPKTGVVVYMVAAAFAHEFGYWRNFNIQILEHIGLADLPKLALWPFVATAGIAFIGVLLGQIAGRDLYPPGGGVNTPVGKFLNRTRAPFGLAFLLFGISSFYFLPNPGDWWLVGPFLIACGVTIAIDTEVMWARLGWRVPERLTLLAIFVLCAAFGTGQNRASSVIDGVDYLEARLMDSAPQPVRYLGRAGDYVFFWNPATKATEIYSLGAIQPLRLQRVKGERA
jgi:hypothetical protein